MSLAELASANAAVGHAREILGPEVGGLVATVGTWPSGAAFDVRVLCLGESHSHGALGPGVSTVELLQAACFRAQESGTCVDAYVEAPAERRFIRQGPRAADDPPDLWYVAEDDGTLPQLLRRLDGCIPRGQADPTIERARGQLAGGPGQSAECPLNLAHARVHAFDARVGAVQGSGDAGQVGLWQQAGAYTMSHAAPAACQTPEAVAAWLAYLMGLDPTLRGAATAPPPGFVGALTDLLGEAQLVEDWMAGHDRIMRRVRKRARAMDVGDVAWLARIVIDTTEIGRQWWGSVMSSATDFYLLLRIFAPYTKNRGPCGPPRHAVVYAGTFHVTHVVRALASMARVVVPRLPSTVSKVLRVSDIVIPGAPAETVGQLLDLLGLPSRADHQVEQDLLVLLRATPFSLKRPAGDDPRWLFNQQTPTKRPREGADQLDQPWDLQFDWNEM
jgi:hypothetical protein